MLWILINIIKKHLMDAWGIKKDVKNEILFSNNK